MGLIVSVPDHCLSFYIINKQQESLNEFRQFYKNLYGNPNNNPEQDLNIINTLTD